MKRKRCFPLFLIPLFILVIFIAFLPMIASTSWGKTKLFNYYGKKRGIEVSARSLSLNWWGPQTFEELAVRDPTKGVQFLSEKLSCPRSLFFLIFSSCKDIDAQGATLLIEMPNGEPVRFSNIELKMRWPKELVLRGETAGEPFDLKIANFPSNLEAEAHFSGFPIYAIDQLLSRYMKGSEGLFLSLIGPTVNLNASVDTEGDNQEMMVTAQSHNFSATVRGLYDGKQLKLKEPAKIQFQLTPQLLQLVGAPLAIQGPIPATIELTEFQIPLEKARGSAIISSLPLENQELRALVGDSLRVNFSYSHSLLTLSAQTPTLALGESFFKHNGGWVLQKPTELHFLSPDAIKNPWVHFSEPFALSIQDLKFPSLSAKATLEPPQFLIGKFPVKQAHIGIDLQDAKLLSVNLKSSTLNAKLKAELEKSLALDASCTKLDVDSVGTLHNLSLQAGYDYPTQTLEAEFSARSLASDVSGRVDLEIEKTPKNLSGKLEMEKFSSAFLDLFYPNLRLRAWLGPTVSANGSFDFNEGSGPLDLRLHSTNARLTATGSMQGGILRLEDPLYAELQLTEELAPLLLEEVNPLSVPTITSTNPLTLEIAPEHTTIPLLPFNPALLNISKARLNLGQISCANVGNIHYTLQLLQQKFLNEKDLHLWFAPADLSISNGIASLERTEILIDKRIEICSWGDVNIPGDSVQMVIGIPAETIKKVFGIKDLPSKYVLQLPMYGPLNNIKIDSSKATSKIGALMLWKKAATAGAGAIGGLPGMIAGELFGKVTLPDRDKKAPPAKRPFPWEG